MSRVADAELPPTADRTPEPTIRLNSWCRMSKAQLNKDQLFVKQWSQNLKIVLGNLPKSQIFLSKICSHKLSAASSILQEGL